MNKQELIKYVENTYIEKKNFPVFNSGDTISVGYTIKEGNKERIQNFQGTIIQVKGTGENKTFTVRKISSGIGVERIFPINSPFIQDIKVLKRGKVRRSRIYYLRELRGKRARIQERG
ncbi:MAG: 50S ribosomal protein L19 [Bacteroidales bacterium]|nr:50S ribosomal protein L19 [Bacteroidales bacterium]